MGSVLSICERSPQLWCTVFFFCRYNALKQILSSNFFFFFFFLVLLFFLQKSTFPFSSTQKLNTFECICGPWGKILVRVELEGQLPVCLLQIIITSIFGNTKNLIKVLAILYPAETKDNGCQNTMQNFKKEKDESVRSQFNVISQAGVFFSNRFECNKHVINSYKYNELG